MSKPVLGYWSVRGFAQPIRMLLGYLGVDYEDKQYSYGPPPDFSRDSWLREKFTLGLDFPNLPYWIDGNVKLTESKAMFKYITRSLGPHLMPTDALSQAVADMVEGVANDILRALVDVTYGEPGPYDEDLEVSLREKLTNLNTFLTNKNYVLEDTLTYVDFFLYEVLYQLQKFSKDILRPYVSLEKFLERIKSLPQLKDYFQSYEALPCYSPLAKHHYYNITVECCVRVV